jgi:ubiquinone/menaquinone biosynthesis C-methylase UbiE
MSDPSQGPLRIWEGSRAAVHRPLDSSLPDSATSSDAALHALARALEVQEILRCPARGRELVEPLSLQWYQGLEQLRHQRHGRWISSLLEFGKHAGERLLGLGVGLGTDLAQYASHGSEVVAACPSAEQLALVRRNFELRGLPASFVHAPPHALPLESGSIDVVCLMGLIHETADPPALLDEIYRVLKPGGKVLAVVPARYDVDCWSRWFRLNHRSSLSVDARTSSPLPVGLLSASARRFHSREMKQLFHRFSEPRLWKRHLRRAETPHPWRWLPIALLERLMGRLLVFKGFKPVSAAIGEQAAA